MKKKKKIYNISCAIHSNNISEILILFNFFEICIRVTGALHIKKTVLHTLSLLVFKVVESLQCILNLRCSQLKVLKKLLDLDFLTHK